MILYKPTAGTYTEHRRYTNRTNKCVMDDIIPDCTYTYCNLVVFEYTLYTRSRFVVGITCDKLS